MQHSKAFLKTLPELTRGLENHPKAFGVEVQLELRSKLLRSAATYLTEYRAQRLIQRLSQVSTRAVESLLHSHSPTVLGPSLFCPVP